MLAALKPYLPKSVIRVAREVRFQSKAVHAAYRTAVESFSRPLMAPDVSAPPPNLRSRVHGNADLGNFIHTGKAISSNIVSVLQSVGANPASVLDFGCGCGRVITYLREYVPAKYVGIDVDPDVIKWSKENIPFADFIVGPSAPPLPFADSSFNLIFTVSVFSHLDLEHSRMWANELSRLVAPGGHLLITTIGKPNFPPDVTNGFTFRPAPKTSWFAANQCDWYGTTYMTSEYAASLFPSLRLVRHIERGINKHQDAILFRML